VWLCAVSAYAVCVYAVCVCYCLQRCLSPRPFAIPNLETDAGKGEDILAFVVRVVENERKTKKKKKKKEVIEGVCRCLRPLAIANLEIDTKKNITHSFCGASCMI